jgi:hypothetical protein
MIHFYYNSDDPVDGGPTGDTGRRRYVYRLRDEFYFPQEFPYITLHDSHGEELAVRFYLPRSEPGFFSGFHMDVPVPEDFDFSPSPGPSGKGKGKG